ncbi:MAG: hypothetical protein FWG45_07385 [Oscillospiraceae bacterium]|nr:hypothetical protein [Oscillospiraceae bacterium]
MIDSQPKAWYKLDNAAKIFPPTSSKSDTKVFRFSCELNDAIDPATLQSALDAAIDDFAGFRCTLKRGMFWYYLEQSDIMPRVHEEDTPPCSMFYLERKGLLFEVTWYGKRINVEIYHALTDGTGAVQFIKTIVAHYLKITHPETQFDVGEIDYDASDTQKMNDSFNKYYGNEPKHVKRTKMPTAHKLRGAKEPEWRFNIIEGTLSVSNFLREAHNLDATMTTLVTALLMQAIFGEMSVRERKRPVIITVPVNLRNYFDSKSNRNFFGMMYIKHDFNRDGTTLTDIIASVKACFAEQLNPDYVRHRMNKMLAFEHNPFIRIVPLSLKNIVMKSVYHMSVRMVTAQLSNIGKITMPSEVKPLINKFSLFTPTERAQVCICSYEDTLTITFTSPFVSKDVQCRFFRGLADMGLAVEITANDLSKQK